MALQANKAYDADRFKETQSQKMFDPFLTQKSGTPSDAKSFQSKRGNEIDIDTQFESQIDQLILKGKDLQQKMAQAEHENLSNYPKSSPYEIFPSNAALPPSTVIGFAPARFEPKLPDIYFDKAALNQSIELEKLKLGLDNAALLGENEDAERKNEPKDKEQLTFDKIDNMKVVVCDFECDNDNLLTRLKNEKVLIECLVPNVSMSTETNPIYDTFKFYSRETNYNKFIFNNEISQTLDMKEGELKLLINSSIHFRIFLQTQNSANPKNFEEISLEVARGTFPLEKLVLSLGYSGSFVVKMMSKIPLDSESAKSQAAKLKKTKKE